MKMQEVVALVVTLKEKWQIQGNQADNRAARVSKYRENSSE
jgi:hypothetical protein